MYNRPSFEPSALPNSLLPQNSTPSGFGKYRRGEQIYRPGQTSDQIYLIVEGKVKIGVLNAEQKEITKAIYGPGELFGEAALIGEKCRRDTATALESAVVRTLSVPDMLLILQGDPKLAMEMMQMVAARRYAVEQRLESLVFQDSRSRIIECILQLTLERGKRVGYEWVMYRPITHQEIANLTATSRQTVTTTLNDLRASKILTFNRKRMLVRDLDKLKTEIRA